MEQVLSETRQVLTFAGTKEQRKALDKIYPKISLEYDLKFSEEDRSEPQLFGGGAFARGWRQMQAFDPDFQPFD